MRWKRTDVILLDFNHAQVGRLPLVPPLPPLLRLFLPRFLVLLWLLQLHLPVQQLFLLLPPS